MDSREIEALINSKKYKEAFEVLDNLLKKDSNNSDWWFLKGVVSLKIKNYDMAQEYFGSALVLGKKPEYYRVKGMAHFEIFEMEKAAEAFKRALELDGNDVIANFFLSMSYLFLDNPEAEEYLKKARKINSSKTKQLVKNFYAMFLKDDPRINDAQKRKIEKHISEI